MQIRPYVCIDKCIPLVYSDASTPSPSGHLWYYGKKPTVLKPLLTTVISAQHRVCIGTLLHT